jgi:hypothetical protein
MSKKEEKVCTMQALFNDGWNEGVCNVLVMLPKGMRMALLASSEDYRDAWNRHGFRFIEDLRMTREECEQESREACDFAKNAD